LLQVLGRQYRSACFVGGIRKSKQCLDMSGGSLAAEYWRHYFVSWQNRYWRRIRYSFVDNTIIIHALASAAGMKATVSRTKRRFAF